MKTTKRFIYLLILPLVLASCNDWLDVSPEDEIGEEKLFADGEGYRNALNGIYKSLAEQGLYGINLTWGIVDAFGQYYDVDNYSGQNDLLYASQYEFDDDAVKPKIKTVWEKAYNVVANCNNIIQNIENEDPDKFTFKESEKQMIWGEALAVRAFVQFDMLRLFAPAPVTNPSKAYIPYVNVYPSYVSVKLPVSECLNHIIDDLKKAKSLVAKRDTILDYRVQRRLEVVGAGEKRFTESRGYRLNYYAVSALLARAYLYAGMKNEAYTEALALIKYQEKTKYFPFNSASSGGRKLYTDVIAGLYAPKLVEWDAEVNDFTKESSYDWKYLKLLNVQKLYDGDLYYDDYYKITTSRDYRYKEQIQEINGNYTPMKNRRAYGTAAVDDVQNRLIPLFRMSEVYYIAAETRAEENLEEAKEYLFKVKSGRGLRSTRIEELRQQITSVPLLRAALLQDARREFMCEGQIFFMHKRMGENIPAADDAYISVSDEKIILPLPDTEISLK